MDAVLQKRGIRPDIIYRLHFIGARGMGALEYGNNTTTSKPINISKLVRLANENAIKDEDIEYLSSVSSFAGGARAKALIAMNPETKEIRSGCPKGYKYYLMKFDGVSSSGDHDFLDPKGFTNIEYAYYLMARKAGIEMMDSFLFSENGRSHFVTERFDRTEDGDKLHMISLGGLCHYDFNAPGSVGYEDAAMAIDDLGLPYSDKRQFFKRMVFNIIFRNQDDHVKNIAFLLDESNTWRLAPAFDITFSYREDSPWVNRHQMTVNGKRDNFTLSDLKEAGSNMNLKRNEYLDVLKEVQDTVPYWEEASERAGVPSGTANGIASMFRSFTI